MKVHLPVKHPEYGRPLTSMASHGYEVSQKCSLHTHTSRQAKQDRLFHTNVQVRQLTKVHGPDYRSGWQSSHGRINLIPLCLTVPGETLTVPALAKTWWQVCEWYFSPAAGKITNSKEDGFSLDTSLVITERSTPTPFRGFDRHSHTVQPPVIQPLKKTSASMQTTTISNPAGSLSPESVAFILSCNKTKATSKPKFP